MRKQISIAILFFFIPFLGHSQNELFLHRTFVNQGDTLFYRVMFPINYDQKKSYPLIIFLHGSGERGSDNEQQLKHGSAFFANDSIRKRYPAIVIFPQCPLTKGWVDFNYSKGGKFIFKVGKEPTQPLRLVNLLVKKYKLTKTVDTRRIYVMGLSLGGMGTFDLICRYPKTYAAAIPICGAVDMNRLKKCYKMPIRIYHGSDDNAVSTEYSRNAFKTLKDKGSKQVEYIEFSGVGHDSWNHVFANANFLSWLFSKKK